MAFLQDPALWLPVVFFGLMGVAFFIYAILDGYDLGVGILLPWNSEAQRDTMIASIGPFWDANETWLVLGVGILLIAFPAAHSVILYQLYLPAALMLAGLILRGVAFDFRAKVAADHKKTWDKIFQAGSLIATLTQGYMLGLYVMGFERSLAAYLFAGLSAICVTAAYVLIGAAWLVLKTEGDLQKRAAQWGYRSTLCMGLGLLAVSCVNPWVSDMIFDRWFAGYRWLYLMVIPASCLGLLWLSARYFKHCPYPQDAGAWQPFACATGLFFFSFLGLGYSFFPYVVPGGMDIWQAASAPESLQFILYGVLIVLPTILIYTFFVYRIFRGKATQLHYY